MNSEEIKQTNIYNFFTKNKRSLANFRAGEEKFNTDLLKKHISRRDKNDANKTNNFKIKDFFTFREYPEAVNELDKELKNMHILSSGNNNKTGIVESSNFNTKISSFNINVEQNNYNNNIPTKNTHNYTTQNTINNFNSTLANTNLNIVHNSHGNLSTKEKKNSYGISKYFPILESKEENKSFMTKNKSLNNAITSLENSSCFINNEVEKVFILDHFNNRNEISTNSENKLQIELNHTLDLKNNSNENIFSTNESQNKLSNNINNKHTNNLAFKRKNSASEDYEMAIQKPLMENPFKVLNKSKYQDTKITKYIHIMDPPNMKLNRELLVNVLEFIDLRHLIRKVPTICKFWNDLYNKTVSSASYNVKIDFTDTTKINEREIELLFKKGKNLKHIKLLKEIISEDFGGNKGIENFFRRIALIMILADPEEIHHKGVMLNSFKLRPRKPNEMHNFISTRSINLTCEASKYSLKTLILRNCSKLSNKVFEGISSCMFLQTLEISFNE